LYNFIKNSAHKLDSAFHHKIQRFKPISSESEINSAIFTIIQRFTLIIQRLGLGIQRNYTIIQRKTK